jgi:hypothetical protein
MPHGQSVDLYLHVEVVHFACQILIIGGGGVKNRGIFHTEIGLEVSTCTCIIELIQTARAKYSLLSVIRVSKEVAKQFSNKHGKMLECTHINTRTFL